MHYRDNFYQKTKWAKTMTISPNNTNPCELHNPNTKLTDADKNLLNEMYRCNIINNYNYYNYYYAYYGNYGY
jgi:hypothetical protein